MGRIALVSWLLTAAISYFVAGRHLERLLEGYNRDALSSLPLLVTGVALLVSLALTGVWAARRRGAPEAPARSGRRRFLLGALGAGTGFAATILAPIAPAAARWAPAS